MNCIDKVMTNRNLLYEHKSPNNLPLCHCFGKTLNRLYNKLTCLKLVQNIMRLSLFIFILSTITQVQEILNDTNWKKANWKHIKIKIFIHLI